MLTVGCQQDSIPVVPVRIEYMRGTGIAFDVTQVASERPSRERKKLRTNYSCPDSIF